MFKEDIVHDGRGYQIFDRQVFSANENIYLGPGDILKKGELIQTLNQNPDDRNGWWYCYRLVNNELVGKTIFLPQSRLRNKFTLTN